MEVNGYQQLLHFWVNYPFNINSCLFSTTTLLIYEAAICIYMVIFNMINTFCDANEIFKWISLVQLLCFWKKTIMLIKAIGFT